MRLVGVHGVLLTCQSIQILVATHCSASCSPRSGSWHFLQLHLVPILKHRSQHSDQLVLYALASVAIVPLTLYS